MFVSLSGYHLFISINFVSLERLYIQLQLEIL